MNVKDEIHGRKNERSFWSEWRTALYLGLLLMAFLAAPGAKAWDPSHPIIGSIAEDLIAIGDRQYGPTEYIVERQDGFAFKTRHQRVSLEGAELFCTQSPDYSQRSYLGIRINSYNEENPITICNVVDEPTPSLTYREMIEGLKNKAKTTQDETESANDDWLVDARIRTERSYCIGNFDSREFTAPHIGTWLAEGTELKYQSGMFTGFEVAADRESGTLIVVSSLLDREAAREMGCALYPARIVVKISASQAQNFAENSEAP